MQLNPLKWLKPGYKDPSIEAGNTLSQIPDLMKQYYEPFMQNAQNPGQAYNRMGADYQQSPGYQFALEQAMMAGDNAAAAGGMAGSQQHQYQNMQTATGMANQDYQNYMNGATHMYDSGQQATDQYTQAIMDELMARAGMQYGSTQSRNSKNMAAFQSLLNFGAKGVGYKLGGAAGATAMG